MPIFIYRALNKEGHRQEGEVQAESRGMAIEYLQREKLTPLFIEKIGYVEKKKFSLLNLLLLGGGIDASDRIFLTRHLSAILKSGISYCLCQGMHRDPQPDKASPKIALFCFAVSIPGHQYTCALYCSVRT